MREQMEELFGVSIVMGKATLDIFNYLKEDDDIPKSGLGARSKGRCDIDGCTLKLELFHCYNKTNGCINLVHHLCGDVAGLFFNCQMNVCCSPECLEAVSSKPSI